MQSLRQSLRQKRQAVAPQQRDIFERKLLTQCRKIGIFRSVKNIAIYLPNDFEIDPIHLHNFLKKHGFSIYLPILSGKSLKFAKIQKTLKKNKFGIFEPVSSIIKNANQLNLIFTPLVGFDSAKNRIGMGCGYYDRALSFKKRPVKFHTTKIIGLAFDCQKTTSALPSHPWDVPLDMVITPTKILR